MAFDDDSATQTRKARVWERVNARFALILALALLPLGVVALVQTRNLQAEAQGRTEQAMLGATLRAATGEVSVIRYAQGAVAALASTPSVIRNTSDCAAAMRLTAQQIPTASLVAFVPSSGLMTCSSNGRSYDYSALQQFHDILQAREPTFAVNRHGPVSGTSILLATHPVLSEGGDYLGYTTIALPHTGLDNENNTFDPLAIGLTLPAIFWTFDRDGEVLTASNGMDDVARVLPTLQTLTAVTDSIGMVYNDITVDGVARTFSVVPIIPGELMLMGSWDYDEYAQTKGLSLSPYLPPVIMWAIGMIVAAWAAEWLVSRHVRRLTHAIGRFARGDRSLQVVDMSEAPAELREAGEAFTSMADGVMRGEATLEDSIHQKEVLLREVHHRVKNNLQLIASIMNLQMRKAVAPESKVLLKGLHDRVMSLATIHRGLYQTTGLADVRADELLADIARQVVAIGSGPERWIDLSTALEEVHLVPDQAVPLSLLLTEAMTNAMKYAGSGLDGHARITLRLRRIGGRAAVMEVENTLSTQPVPDEDALRLGTGLGAQLLKAFAMQLGGKIETDQTPTAYRVIVSFDVTSLADAENLGAVG